MFKKCRHKLFGCIIMGFVAGMFLAFIFPPIRLFFTDFTAYIIIGKVSVVNNG